MKVCRSIAVCLGALLFLCGLAPAPALAQTVTGEIRGTVRDSSGGVLPGVTVTVTNTQTGLNPDRYDERHRHLRVPKPAHRRLHHHRGAAGLPQGGADRIRARRRRPRHRRLLDGVGAMTETVTVEAIRGDTVNRTSGEVARVVDGETVRSLALSGRNYLELASLIPGAVTTDDDQMAVMTGLGTGGTVINGNRGNSNNLTVDGGFNLDSGSNASMINNVSIDFIDQVAIQTSNFAADKGRNAGASINVVTKSGTNQFGGSLTRRTGTTSSTRPNFFAPKDPSGKQIKAKENFHNYGGGVRRPDRQEQAVLFHRHGVQVARSPGIAAAPDAADAGRAAGRLLRQDPRSRRRRRHRRRQRHRQLADQPGDRPGVPGPHHPAEPVHRGRPRDRQGLRADDRAGGRV